MRAERDLLAAPQSPWSVKLYYSFQIRGIDTEQWFKPPIAIYRTPIIRTL